MFCSARKLLIILFILPVVGCKWIHVENGRIPRELLPVAQAYMGEYFGSFDGLTGKLVISLNGDYVDVSFVDGKDNDLLGAHCESKIGALEYLYVEGDDQNPELSEAHFNFDANKCSNAVHGKTLKIRFGSDRSLFLLIVERYYPDGGDHAYLEGTFRKN